MAVTGKKLIRVVRKNAKRIANVCTTIGPKKEKNAVFNLWILS